MTVETERAPRHEPVGRGRRRAVDGVLLLDKPAGITSQTAVARVKALYDAAKAGHTGTLDPMATGLLPIAFGEATKFSSALLDAAKGYLATVRLGTTTTTGDLEGEVTAVRPVDVDRGRLEAILRPFRGPIEQTPPMFSALKHQGKPLYAYAREGRDVAREPRAVTIEALELEAFQPPDIRIHVKCSKGTYIRVLAEDVGAALGCGACLASLRRTEVDRFTVANAIGLDALAALTDAQRRGCLLPVDAMLLGLPAIALDPAAAGRMLQGGHVAWQGPEAGLVRLYGPAASFLGVAHAEPGGVLQPRRLVAQKAPNS